MSLIKRLAVAFIGAAFTVQSSLADSTQRNPLNYASLLRGPVIETPGRHVHAYSNFDLTFLLHDGQQKIRLSLEPNHDVLHDDAVVHIVRADGTTASVETVDRSEHRVFKGHAYVRHDGHSEWTNAGWARITIHRDGRLPIFEGAFRIDGDHHHIQTGENYRKLKHSQDPDVVADDASLPDDEYMVVWRDSDIVPYYYDGELKKREIYGRSTCTSDSLTFNNQPLEGRDEGLSAVHANSLFARQSIDAPTGNNGAGVNLVSTIGSTLGCPNTRKVALVGIAADCTYTASFNSTQSVRTNIIQQINAASQVYESTFNISLGIMNLTIQESTCPGTAVPSAPWNVACSPGVSITDRLNLFSAWRGLSRDNNAFWTLLSTCNTDAAVGLAWLGQVCVPGAQTAQVDGGRNETIASANVVIKTPSEWQVIAHETGHTFGAVHDCISPTCGDGSVGMQKCCPLSSSQCDAGGQFIMNPSTGSGIRAFSPCSIGNICSAMGRSAVRTGCLTNNKDVSTITGSQCGNGIVEQGEDCDCGGPDGCGDNTCCDARTCRFTSGSVCDPSNEDCCTQQCQFAAGGTVCRASTGSCDPAETCTGNTPMCPPDSHQDDGSACGEAGRGLTCASGQCTSRDQQCRTMIGARTLSNDTYACSSSGCLLSCASPQFGPNMCVTMNQNFLDGTPCQGGGRCSNGRCEGSSVANEITGWLNENRNIVIPVASVVGGLILIALVSCCISTVRRRRARKRIRAARPPKPAMQPNSWASYGGQWNIPHPPRRGHRSPPTGSGPTGSGPLPPVPAAAVPRGGAQAPPAYTPYPGQWQPYNSDNQGRSMRYA